jgi:hypothetical protein
MIPQALLDRLVELFPGFEAYWNGSLNCSRHEDGTFTLHGVFIEFSHFFREHYAKFASDRIAMLGAFISQCMSSNDDDLDNAAATCFIENIANEKCGEALAQYLTGEARSYLQAWADCDSDANT